MPTGDARLGAPHPCSRRWTGERRESHIALRLPSDRPTMRSVPAWPG